MNPTPRHRPERTVIRIAAAGWILLLLALVIPADLASPLLSPPGDRFRELLATTGLFGSMLALLWLMPRRAIIPAAAVAVVVAACMLVRLLHYGIARFAGIGFGSEFFMHLQPESVHVALLESPALVIAGTGLVVAVMLAAFALSRRTPRPSTRVALSTLAGGTLMLVGGHAALPEWQLAKAAEGWFTPQPMHLSPEKTAEWTRSALVELQLPPKDALHARTTASSRNLILLYIESGGLPLITANAYPDLMPNLARLQREHALAPYLRISAYITIEGIVNSQCGTLFPFDRGSDSLVGSINLAENMACLGDVLAAAGYHQSYLGGAGLEFAGKGAFLAAHGYDRRYGTKEWGQLGLHQRPGSWGLSDADLFEQSFRELAYLRAAGGPFNLTLLTIGTHLPGFPYEECEPYGDGGEVFLDAAHCSDQLIGRWVERLQAEGQLVDTTLVITGDHHIFPSADMRRLFGDELVFDRRVPLIVIGPDPLPEGLPPGGSYDLAPTVLDLLRVEHDARFALGRSLLHADPHRDYFITRYGDYQHGAPVPEGGHDCDDAVPGGIRLPLDRCRKRELLALLGSQVRAFSRASGSLDCREDTALEVRVPAASAQPTTIRYDGVDQVSRFAWRTRSADPLLPGLYIAEFGATGHVLEQRFVAAAEATDPQLQPRSGAAALRLVAWRPGQARTAPSWLPPHTEPSGAWLLSRDGRVLHAARQDADGSLRLAMDAQECHRLLPDAP